MRVSLTQLNMAIEGAMIWIEDVARVNLKRQDQFFPDKNMTVISIDGSSQDRPAAFHVVHEEECQKDDKENEEECFVQECRVFNKDGRISTVIASLGDIPDYLFFCLCPDLMFVRQLQYAACALNLNLRIAKDKEGALNLSMGRNPVRLVYATATSSTESQSLQSAQWHAEYRLKTSQAETIKLESYPLIVEDQEEELLECAWWQAEEKKQKSLRSHPTTAKNLKIVLFLLGANEYINK